jgi:hypothetical protein
MAIFEAKTLITGGIKAKKCIVPVMNLSYSLTNHFAHDVPHFY